MRNRNRIKNRIQSEKPEPDKKPETDNKQEGTVKPGTVSAVKAVSSGYNQIKISMEESGKCQWICD